MRILCGGDIFVLLFNILEVMTQKSANDNRNRLARDYANNCLQSKVNRLPGNGFCKTPSEPITYRGNCYNHFNRYPSLNNIHSNYRIDSMRKYHQLGNFQYPEEFLYCYFRPLIKNIPNNGNAPIVADRTYDLLTSRIRALQKMPPYLKSYQVPSKRAHPLTKYFELFNAADWRARVFEKEKCASPNNGITLSNFDKWLPQQIAQHTPESTYAATPLLLNKTMPWNKCSIPRSKLHAVEKHHFKTSKMSYQLIFNFLCGDYNTFFDLCRRFLTPPSRSISTNNSELQQCVCRCEKFFVNDSLPRSKVHDFKHDHSDPVPQLGSQLNHNSNIVERTPPTELKQNKSEISVASEESNTTMVDVNAKIDLEISTEAVFPKENTFTTLLHSTNIYSHENGSLTSF